MSCEILGIGTAVPTHTMSQQEALVLSSDLICRDERELRLLRTMLRRSRVAKRHTCVPYQIAYQWAGEDAMPSTSPGPTTRERMELYAAHAGPLALEASAKAMAHAGTLSQDITHLITVSCTGFAAPGVDVQLIEQLALPQTTQRIHVGYMGCHGLINGLRVADAFAASCPHSKTLLCATELCSLHYRFQWDDTRILGNALFADGAAALVAGHANGGEQFCRLKTTGSCLVPDSKEAITWNIGNHGFEMTISNRVPQLIGEFLQPWLSQWLDSQGLTKSEVGSWAVHPGGPRILDAVEQALDLGPNELLSSREILEEFGNMSSPTILFIMQRLLDGLAPRPYIALGFGPGLMIEAAAFE